MGATYIPRDYAVVPEYLRGEGDPEILTVGYVVALLHRRPKGRTKERGDEANETQSWGGLQDTGGVRRGPRREDAGGVGPTIWRASHPDHGMEAAVADTSRRRVWRDDEGHGGQEHLVVLTS